MYSLTKTRTLKIYIAKKSKTQHPDDIFPAKPMIERMKKLRSQMASPLLICLTVILLNFFVSVRAAVVVGWGGYTASPTNIPLNLTNVIAITASGNRNLALKEDGTTISWGSGKTNALPGLTNAIAIASGYEHD